MTLVIVPAMFTLVDDLERWIGPRFRRLLTHEKDDASLLEAPLGTYLSTIDAVLAPHVPTAILFVPSRGGISHTPEEFTPIDNIVAAATILLETVRDRRLE